MNMDLEYRIVGGLLKIQKTAFVLEMLGKESLLRKLLNWKSAGDFKGEHPAVGKPDDNGLIIIDFSYISDVSLGKTWEELFKQLKSKYRNKVKGRIACSSNYWGILSSFEIDLNSDGDSIEYIKN